MTKDPVCGMMVDESKAAATATHDGRTYHFCSDSCRARFVEDPSRYVTSGRDESR